MTGRLLCSDSQSVVTSRHDCTYCQSATKWSPRAGTPAMDITRQRSRGKEDECLLKPNRLNARLTS